MRGGAGSLWGCIWGHAEGMLSGRAPTLGSAELSCCSACPLPPASPKPFSCWGRVLFFHPPTSLVWARQVPTSCVEAGGQQLRLLCTALSRLPGKWPFPVFVVQDAELYFFPSCPCTLGCCPRFVTNKSRQRHLSQLCGEPQESCQRVIFE